MESRNSLRQNATLLSAIPQQVNAKHKQNATLLSAMPQ